MAFFKALLLAALALPVVFANPIQRADRTSTIGVVSTRVSSTASATTGTATPAPQQTHLVHPNGDESLVGRAPPLPRTGSSRAYSASRS
jgi:hypothetical protein